MQRVLLKKLAISNLLIIFLFNQFALATDFRFSPRPNKAHLIKWRQWGKESLAEAKKKKKLILLSLSAVWCHWCHVMDETTYSDTNIIDYINNNFIPVRVDANMRPDIDSIYNQGGWPSTDILTPEGEIVQGATYVSQEVMIEWLSKVLEMFTKDRKGIRERIETLKKRKESGRQGEPAVMASPDIGRITGMIESAYDKRFGGFGVSQKFPNPDAIDFLLTGYLNGKDPELKIMILTTLTNMSKGEIYDHVEGGFFRYSTMPDWSVPHYEKMLDLNAELIRNYASAYMVFGDTNYKKVFNEVINYVEKYFYDNKTGAFYGSQDADEGYYKKTMRDGLKPPYVDSTIYADSNAQMVTALVAAYNATGERRYLERSEKTAGFIIKNLYSPNNGVYHYYLGEKYLSGLISDNVLFGLALIDLYNVTAENRYLNTAEDIASLLLKRFYDNETKLFRPSLETTVVNPSTAGMLSDYNTILFNYRAVIFLSRLYYNNRTEQIKSIIEGINSKLKTVYERYGPSAALYGTALRWRLEEPLEITIIGEDTSSKFLLPINKIYIPQKVVKILSLKKEKERIKELGYPLIEAVYVCLGKNCSAPMTKPEDFISGIKKFIEIPRQKEK